MANFYHKFVPRFVDVAAPLNALPKKMDEICVEPKATATALRSLENSQLTAPCAGMANFSKTFIIQTDASGVALAAVLSQEHNGVRQPIAYVSRTLSTQERKVSSTYEWPV